MKKLKKVNKLNVLFVNLPSVPLTDLEASYDNKSLRQQFFSMPLGVMYISSYLKKNGNVDHVRLLDYSLAVKNLLNYKGVDDFIISVAKEKVNFHPDVIALSLIFSSSYPFFKKCLKPLLKKWPQAKFVVGGTHATNTVKVLLEKDKVDYVFRGEAEFSFTEFINQLSHSKRANIKGVYSKENLEILKKASSLELSDWPEDLDKLPFPDWGLIDMNTYIRSLSRQREFEKERPTASIFTTRGCPFRCTFCSAHTVHGRRVRMRSVENILKEIKLLNKKYGVLLFVPEDDMFTANKQRIIKLLRGIKALDISSMEIMNPNGLSVNMMDEDLIDEFIASGMKIATLAIESGSEYVQKHLIKKNCNLKKARELINLLKSRGVTLRCFFVLGFPHETKEQMQETVDYAKSLQIDWCIFSIATPLVGSEMYNEFVEMGCIKDGPESWANTVYDTRTFDTPDMSADEMNDFFYRANLDCNFINNPNKVNGHYDKAIRLYKDIVLRYPFHVIAWYCMVDCYKGMGDKEQAKKIEQDLRKLIKNDTRAAEMFSKYSDMMKGFEFRKA